MDQSRDNLDQNDSISFRLYASAMSCDLVYLLLKYIAPK